MDERLLRIVPDPELRQAVSAAWNKQDAAVRRALEVTLRDSQLPGVIDSVMEEHGTHRSSKHLQRDPR